MRLGTSCRYHRTSTRPEPPINQRPAATNTPYGGPDDERPNIILTGFMGTGKSTVGRLLAQLLEYRWVDTDDLIESRHGPIPEIFAHDGEAAFRALERHVAEELSEQHGLVISTGGRMLLDPENERLLEMSGSVWCLVASPKAIIDRLTERGASRRPLLEGPDLRDRITKLLAERRPGYRRFPQITTDGKTAADVARQIAEQVETSAQP